MLHYFPWLDYEYAAEIRNFSGEVDRHTLEVAVNELGSAVLAVEGSIEDGGVMKDIQPPVDDSEYDDDGFMKKLSDMLFIKTETSKQSQRILPVLYCRNFEYLRFLSGDFPMLGGVARHFASVRPDFLGSHPESRHPPLAE